MDHVDFRATPLPTANELGAMALYMRLIPLIDSRREQILLVGITALRDQSPRIVLLKRAELWEGFIFR